MKIYNQEDPQFKDVPTSGQTYQAQTLEDAMRFIEPIPDTLVLNHEFLFRDECNFLQEESIFSKIPSIGELRIGQFIEIKYCQCKFGGGRVISQPCNCPCCACSCCGKKEFLHAYPGPEYTLQNDLIKFQHFGRLSKLFVKGYLALEFHVSDYNVADLVCGGCYSSHPHIMFKNPSLISNPSVYFEPQMNDCPTKPNACIPPCCAICSFCGMRQLQKDIKVDFLSNDPLYNAFCQIQTRRTSRDACYSQCGCKICCKIVDYPTMEIKFQNVSQLDRLGIIISCIHYSLSNWWENFGWTGKLRMNSPTIYIDEKDF